MCGSTPNIDPRSARNGDPPGFLSCYAQQSVTALGRGSFLDAARLVDPSQIRTRVSTIRRHLSEGFVVASRSTLGPVDLTGSCGASEREHARTVRGRAKWSPWRHPGRGPRVTPPVSQWARLAIVRQVRADGHLGRRAADSPEQLRAKAPEKSSGASLQAFQNLRNDRVEAAPHEATIDAEFRGQTGDVDIL